METLKGMKMASLQVDTAIYITYSLYSYTNTFGPNVRDFGLIAL